MAQKLNMSNRGTGITLEQQVSPRHGREQNHLSSRSNENYQFSTRDSKRMLQMFLLEVSQI
jgi:hypothetical protein